VKLALATLLVVAGCDLVFPPGKGGGDAAVVEGVDGTSGGDAITTGNDGATVDAFDCSVLTPSCNGDVVTLSCAGACYVMCSVASTWSVARTGCNGVGDLASVPDLAADTCLRGLLSSTSVPTAWIGLRQPDSSLTPLDGWFWGDGAPYTSFGWAVGQPNDVDGVENDQEQCGAATVTGWGDRGCDSNSFPFVCSRLP
jgi:hypothetical protein